MSEIANEYDVLVRLIEGDRTAFDIIYRQYFYPVYNNALRIIRNAEAAEDIAQEVFIALWEKRGTIDASRSIGGWLFVCCYNQSVSLLRKKLKEHVAVKEFQAPPELTADENKDLLQWTILEKAISQLSPRKKKVFELCKLQGKSYKETAAELKISSHTVKEYLAAGVSAVKEYIQHYPPYFIIITTGIKIFL